MARLAGTPAALGGGVAPRASPRGAPSTVSPQAPERAASAALSSSGPVRVRGSAAAQAPRERADRGAPDDEIRACPARRGGRMLGPLAARGPAVGSGGLRR